MAYFVEGNPGAVQIVEFFGDTLAEVEQQLERFVADMKARGIGYAWPIYTDPKGQADVWNTRKLGLGLITNVKGPRKGRDFIEDAEYIGKVMDLCKSMGIDRVSKYAHASVGVVHIAPALDLHLPEDVQRMRQIAEAAFGWVMEYGGSWSGEHGDGQLPGEFLPRMFGDDLYHAFRELKGVFDPDNLMNPGKVVDAPPMTSNLRYGPNYRVAEIASSYHYREQGGFQLAVEQCNGVGVCRKLDTGTMCPSYMATRDEETTTRGRANALRLAMTGQLGEDGLTSDRLAEVLDLCLQCKACKTECPNAVDMAKLKSDVLQMRHDKHGTPLGYRLLGTSPDAAKRAAGLFAPVVNWVQTLGPFKAVLEKVACVDRRRPLPRYAKDTLAKRLRGRTKPQAATRGKVVLFDDTYVNYYEPGVGLAAIALLEGCGFEVILAKAGCCQRPRLSKGLVREAKKHGGRTLANLDEYAKQGLPILCLEPSCASALADDLPDLIDDAELGQRISQQIKMIDVFLDEQGVDLEAVPGAEKVLLHGHCHQKALFGTQSIKRLYDRMPDTHCAEVDSGCCGMAGSFGYEKYDLSMTVGEDRLFPAVRAADPDTTLVACGFSCRHQLADACGVQAKHWVETVRAVPEG